MDTKISGAIKETSKLIEREWKSLGFVTAVPPVMQSNQNVLCGAKQRGSSCLVLAYRCVCNLPINLVKVIFACDTVRSILAKTIKLAQRFRNNHVASDLLSNEKKIENGIYDN